jgi:hypothetical protein
VPKGAPEEQDEEHAGRHSAVIVRKRKAQNKGKANRKVRKHKPQSETRLSMKHFHLPCTRTVVRDK